jgi:aspartyl-tRNA(Asn)/glutamyl-tRNA(Gln) amidotransferase subunit A
MKPTFDAVSGEGELPCHGSLSCVGPICRNVRDAALVFEVIREVTGPPLEIDSGIRGTRVGVPSDIGVCDPEVRALFETACEVIADQGAIVRRIEPPEFPAGRSAMWIITGVEYAEALRPVLRGRPEDLHPLTRALLERAEFIPATEYVHAQRVRSALARAMARTMAKLDVLLVPTVPSPAYIRPTDFEDPGEIGDHPVNMSTYFTALFNTTGQPAVTVPCGVTAAGLPVGLQIAGRPYDEALILRVAQSYEFASGGIGSPPLSISAVDTRQG